MTYHVNRLLADDSHEMSNIISLKIKTKSQWVSAKVVIKVFLLSCEKCFNIDMGHAMIHNRAYADSEGLDQTAHPRSLILTFTVRL